MPGRTNNVLLTGSWPGSTEVNTLQHPSMLASRSLDSTASTREFYTPHMRRSSSKKRKSYEVDSGKVRKVVDRVRPLTLDTQSTHRL